ncbi:MAG: flagellar assembly protein FliH [Thioalkalispiraceae bacterium]|jgi:flagellar assembly protein FliH
MSSSKPDKATLEDDVKLWKLPDIMDEEKKRRQQLATASELEDIQKQAYEEAHQKGYQDGMQRSEQEINLLREKARQLDVLMGALSEPFAELDDSVVEQISDLAIAVARQLIRRELHTDPGQVIAVVREAMAELPVGSRNVEIHLHPEDASLVSEALSLSESEQQATERLWRIVEDPAQTRGGCRISSENSTIDASVETRLNRVIAQMLGGERETDEQPAT